MKKSFKVLFMSCFLGLVTLFGLNVKVKGANIDAYLIETNPAEDTSSSMNIAWHSDVVGTYVLYTKDTDTEFKDAKKINGQCEALTYTDDGAEDSIEKTQVTSYKCGTTLEGLEESTKYIYKVGKDTFSSIYSFETSGNGAFTFMYISDVHTYTKYPSRINGAEALVNVVSSKYKNMKLIVTGGDMLAYGTVRDSWLTYHNWSGIKNYMVASTPGNHEYYDRNANILADSKKYFNIYTNNPDNGAEGVKNGSYFFYYGNVLFISIDSEAYRLSSQPEEYETNQKKWLIETLENNHAQFVVLFHHAYYYPGNDNSGPLLKSLQSIIDKYGVDLVLTGHDHVYTRSKRIYNSLVSTDAKKGAIYITSSAVGDRLEASNSTPNDSILDKKIGDTSLALGITVTDTQMTVKTYDDKGNIVDQTAIIAKMNKYEVVEEMKKVNVTVDSTDFSKQTLNFPEEFFGKCYNVEVKDKDGNILCNTYPTDSLSTLVIPGISNNSLSEKFVVNAYFRDGQIGTKEIEVINPNATFGKIENVRIENFTLFWDSQLDNDLLKKIIIYVDDVAFGDLNPTANELSLAAISIEGVKNIRLVAYGENDKILFEQSLLYGQEIKNVEGKFLENFTELKVGEEKTISVEFTPDVNFEYTIASSDESVLKIVNGKIIALKEGTATITISTSGQLINLKSPILTITVKKADSVDPVDPIDPVEPSEPQKSGCNAVSFISFSMLALGVFILRKKRY